MNKVYLYRLFCLCGSFLLVLLTGTASAPGAAQAPEILPTSQLPVSPLGEATQLQPPSAKDCMNCPADGFDVPSRQSGVVSVQDHTFLENSQQLPFAGDFSWNALHNLPSVVCPVDSDFNGSAAGWVSHSGTWYVGDAYLYTDGVDGTTSSASNVSSFTNFTYEASMMRLGCDNCSNRLLFRGTPDPLTGNQWWNSAYMLQYTRNGFYSIWKSVGGVDTELVGWTPSAVISQGDNWNDLRVVADGSSLSFYINGTLLWSGSDASLSSGRPGVSMYEDVNPNDELRVDWAKLCYLPSSTYLPTVSRSMGGNP